MTTAHNRRQHFLRLGCGENEFHVRWRLLQRFQERVERRRRQHVHLVDDVDFVARLRRRVAHVFAKLAHLFDAIVARAVDLEHVETVAGGDFAAVVARVVRGHGRSVHAIERFGQDPCGRRLADSARPDEQIGVCQAVLRDRVFQRARDVCLADQIVERLWPILPRKDFVAHRFNLNALPASRK